MSRRPGVLARGPWRLDQIEAVWREDAYEPPGGADRPRTAPWTDCASAVRRRTTASPLAWWPGRRRGSPPARAAAGRWALRLLEDASDSLTALCVVRTEDGRWLAGRRAEWVSSWAGRWALGAGGAVDLGESPAETLTRELQEEWRLHPRRAVG